MKRRKYNSNHSYLSINNRNGLKRSKECPLDQYQDRDIDYKNIELLSRFISDYGRILPRRLTGIYAKKQRKLRIAIIRARFLALLPYCTKKI
ncbi:30S ribosomal protein S18 [Wolbachia endosymbiont of Howardula sp.]|uniref:30S ribosomal protein S18 n=1 Tax=Wolbachia endosymbiont of Howardula sp. TaxID=2916816 RepID=UPI00217EE713|nr:30S ribosomal protein S18 [Wolbachia endosymbiont of Howardula sp.]UWI83118.1 30S ribosomal protein S18 [Wolbachia endosymbiont of Howardula sp.]